MPSDSNGNSNPTPDAEPLGGNDVNRNNGNNGRRDQRRQNNQRYRYNNCSMTTTFEGQEPSLKGHVYDYTGDWTPDQYIKTTKEIVNYVGRTYTKYTPEFTKAVQNLKLIDPTPPETPDAGDQIVFEIWKLDIKEYRAELQ